MSADILTEIPPISEKDCFHIVERWKTEFTFPLHHHKEYELNFIERGAGLRRIVGDSIEDVGEYELVLITGHQLEHVWEQGKCNSAIIREITIQFEPDMIPTTLLDKNQFIAIRKMFKQAEQGLAFPMDAIIKVYSLLDSLATEKNSFRQFLKFLELLHELAVYPDARTLASSSFARSEKNTESRRISKVKEFIAENYTGEITLDRISHLAGMSPVSFSRFFRQRTGKSFSDYLIDYRLGIASRMLVDTSKSISEICFDSGFNNLSNFNRLFRKKKDTTPKEFRAQYKKNKYVI